MGENNVCLDIDNYLAAMQFLIATHSLCVYIPLPENCLTPHVIEEPANQNNTDVEMSPPLERSDDGSTYVFTSTHEPDEGTSVFGDVGK